MTLGEQDTVAVAEAAEELRRDAYNIKTNFGGDASPIQVELEALRRAEYLDRKRNSTHRLEQGPENPNLLRRIKRRFRLKPRRNNPQIALQGGGTEIKIEL